MFADPELTLALPPEVTAATGMDALTHNIESYLSPAYHPLCDGIALEGLRIGARALATAVKEPGNLPARSDMMMSSMMGAIAFQKDLGAVHSCAHALGAVADLHHGLANALMIEPVMRFNLEAVPASFDELAHVIGLGGGGEVGAVAEPDETPHRHRRRPGRARRAARAVRTPGASGQPRHLRARRTRARAARPTSRVFSPRRCDMGDLLDIHNPASGALIERVPVHDEARVAAAASAARAAQPAWAARPLAERIDVLRRFRAGIVAETDTLARTLSSEMGKPIAQARNELNGVLGRIDFFCDAAPATLADEQVHDDSAVRERITHQPLGVVANISAWNYPYFVGCNVIVPALITGNAVLYKPSEHATLSGLHISRLLHAAGVPVPLFATLVGRGDTGSALLAQRIDGVFFTGSHATGTAIARALATRLVKVQLELGGKDPAYVRADADVEGGRRIAGRRCDVQHRPELLRGGTNLRARARCTIVSSNTSWPRWRSFRCGDPMDEATYIGAIARAAQLDVLDEQVADARARGARLLTGGHRMPGPGHWFAPTVFTDVEPSDAADARGELRAGHRHPGGRRRRRGAGADERHALRADRRRVHARRIGGTAPAGARERRQRVLELLRPRQPAAAVVGPRRLGHRPDPVAPRHPGLHPAQGLAPAQTLSRCG